MAFEYRRTPEFTAGATCAFVKRTSFQFKKTISCSQPRIIFSKILATLMNSVAVRFQINSSALFTFAHIENFPEIWRQERRTWRG